MPNPDRAALEALIPRLRDEPGAGRDLDAEIWWAFADQAATDGDIRANIEEMGVTAALDRCCGKGWRQSVEMVDPVTGDLSAAVRLFKRVLPGWSRESGVYVELGMARCEIWDKGKRFVVNHDHDGGSEPRAILTALCLALLAQGGEPPTSDPTPAGRAALKGDAP